MFARLFSAISGDTFQNTKQEISNLLTQEWKSTKYSTQANVFFQEAVKLVLNCQNEDELKKLLVGCLTLAFITDDRKYGTKLSKYSYQEIMEVTKNPETNRFLKTKVPYYSAENQYVYVHSGSTYDDYPSASSFLATFYSVADFVLKNPLGCDDFAITHHLKSSAFVAAIDKQAKDEVAKLTS